MLSFLFSTKPLSKPMLICPLWDPIVQSIFKSNSYKISTSIVFTIDIVFTITLSHLQSYHCDLVPRKDWVNPHCAWTQIILGILHQYHNYWCPGSLHHQVTSSLAPGNPTLWSGVPVASIQKSFGSSGRDWKPGKKLPIPCKFFTCRFIRYSSTCYGMVRIDPLMANIRNPDFFASPVVNAARFVVVLPCYLNRDLLSGPKGN